MPVTFGLAMLLVIHGCSNPSKPARARAEATAEPTAEPAATEVPTVEPTPEPTAVPTYYLVTLYTGIPSPRKWRVTTDTKFEIFGSTGVNFKDAQGKDITICGTYTIEEE
jgi:hypothetical protein